MDYIPEGHAYISPAPGASRSPCPALNTLANHGYLNRDGRGITVVNLVRALVEVYNLSVLLAVVLSIVGVVLCGNWWSLDLHQLAKHGVIEHNASLAHADAPSGNTYAPTRVDPGLIKQLLSVTTAPSLTLYDFAKARVQRDVTISIPLDNVHDEIARGEVVLTVEALGSKPQDAAGDLPGCERVVSKVFIEQWLGEERLPDGWHKPREVVGFCGTASQSRRIQKMIWDLLATRRSEV